MGVGDLTKILNELAGDRFGHVVRAKGQLWTDDGWIEFSLVTGTVEMAPPRWPDRQEPPEVITGFGEIVVIGEGLDKIALQALL